MTYGSSDMEFDGHNFLSFWIIFRYFSTLTVPLNHLKNQNLKNMKKLLEDNIILQKCTEYDDYMLHCS